jgi:site-specific DNA-methyltransferase (adenine-specific)
MINLMKGDCLERMKEIESGSVDLIVCDLPYGTMKGINEEFVGYGRKNHDGHMWDTVIDTDLIMKEANRILRKNGKMVLFSQHPFTHELISKSIPNLPFCYSMIWEKNDFANALNAKKAPVNYFEDILVFSKNHQKHDFEGLHPLRDYFKDAMGFIGLTKKAIVEKVGQRADHTFRVDSTQYSLCTEKTYNELISVFGIDSMVGFKAFAELKRVDLEYRSRLLTEMNEMYPSTFNLWEGKKYKSNILKYKKDYDGFHPTQKPVLLLEDLIKTYSNEGNLVVDMTMGSGSTGVAAKNLNRNFIGIEMDDNYFDIATKRINEA